VAIADGGANTHFQCRNNGKNYQQWQPYK
jgi:hypothetical protein